MVWTGTFTTGGYDGGGYGGNIGGWPTGRWIRWRIIHSVIIILFPRVVYILIWKINIFMHWRTMIIWMYWIMSINFDRCMWWNLSTCHWWIIHSSSDCSWCFRWIDNHTPIMNMKLLVVWIQLWHKHKVYLSIFSWLPNNHHCIFWMWKQWINSTIRSTEHTASFKVHLWKCLLSNVLKSRYQFSNLFICWFSHTYFSSNRKWINHSQGWHKTWCWELLWKNMSQGNRNINIPCVQISQQQWVITMSIMMHTSSTKQSVVKIFKNIFKKKFLSLVGHITSWQLRKTLHQSSNETWW